MRFLPFLRHNTGDRDRHPTLPPGGSGSDLGEEVQAYLDGRLVEHLVDAGRPVPVWAAINRLAHADHEELLGLLAGHDRARSGHRGRRRYPWSEDERRLAAHVFVTDGATPEGLMRIQDQALVPVELDLAQRYHIRRFTSEEVFDAASRALDSYCMGA